MMSAALLMLAGAEQSGKPVGPVDPSVDLSLDQGKPGVVSFAKSFSDRLGESAILQGKSSAKDAPIPLVRDSKASPLTKKLGEVVATPSEGKVLLQGIQETAAHGKGKSAATSLGSVPQIAALTRSGEKAAVNDAVAKNVAPAVEEGETTKDASSDSSTSEAVPVVLQPSDDVVAPWSSADEARPSLSNAGSAFVPKQTDGAEKTKEIGSAKKTAKAPQNTTPSKTAQKTAGADGNVVSKPAEAGSREDAGPVSPGIVASTGAPSKDDVSTNGNRHSETMAGKTVVPPTVVSATNAGVVSKETGHETKPSTVDTGTAISSADGQPASPKFSEELEKVATVATVATSGGDSKIQTPSGAGMMMVHPTAGGVASGGVPLVVVSGNTPGETVSTKPQVRDGGAHVTGPVVEMREPGGGLGMVAAPTEAMPTVLKATPTALEVGVQDGMHGWLKVRAEMADGGGVNASVSALSSTGQEMLHRELPGITAYLQQEKVSVNAIAVHTPLATGTEQRNSAGMDGAAGQASQGGHDGGAPQQNVRKGLPAGPDEAMTYQSLHGVDEDGLLSLAGYTSGGSWLSVRA